MLPELVVGRGALVDGGLLQVGDGQRVVDVLLAARAPVVHARVPIKTMLLFTRSNVQSTASRFNLLLTLKLDNKVQSRKRTIDVLR